MHEVPKIIHQLCIDTDLDHPAQEYAHKAATWKSKNPSCRYVFWNKCKVVSLWKDPLLTKWKDHYQSLKSAKDKTEYCKNAILYVHGGVYADLDSICSEAVSFTVDKVPIIKDGWVISTPKHELWETLLDKYGKDKEPTPSTTNTSWMTSTVTTLLILVIILLLLAYLFLYDI